MAGEFLFDRRARLLIATPTDIGISTVTAQTIEITDLRIAFKIKKSLTKDPNSAEITIYNLAASTRAQLQEKGARVILEAGYDKTTEQIYVGDARQIFSRNEGPEWETVIRCGDGERGAVNARISESFAAGVPFADVITKIGKATSKFTGLNVGNILDVAPRTTGQFTQGYTVYGEGYAELAKVLKVAGYDLSIQDGELQALAPGETTTEQVIFLDPESGLIGSPEMGTPDKETKKAELKAKSLIQGGFRPGRRVQIKSAAYQGTFKIIKVEHEGDTAGGNWYSDLDLEVT